MLSSAHDDHFMIVLIPECNDPLFSNLWQSAFVQYTSAFSTLADISVLPLPWPKAPLTVPARSKTTYVAGLVWGYHFVVDR
ncbi:unnamed protein product [Rotaria sp. Silwood2]|nr:unnamed protein product [Rotaria sp. Silwood2]CAF4210434.1 unnamed protein product [Rotaria sp. Silwood2]